MVTETVWYLGYEIEACSKDFLVFAPNRDVACFASMATARGWIKRHRKLGTRQEKGGGPTGSAGAAQSSVLPPRPVELAQANRILAMSRGPGFLLGPQNF